MFVSRENVARNVLPKFWGYGNFGGYGVEPHQNQIMVKTMYGNVVFFYLCHFL